MSLTLLCHPKIYLDARGRTTDALLIADGHILATGDEARARYAARAAGSEAQRVDAPGTCLFPALADAHIHLWGLGLRAGMVDLRGMMPAEILTALQSAQARPSGWVLGTNWDQNIWPVEQTLDLAALDRTFGQTPVCLRRVDGHAFLVNSAALELAGIGPDYDPGPGGKVERDAMGRPTGRLVDAAMNPVSAVLPQPTEDEDRATFVRTAQMLLAHGITSAHMAWMPWNRLHMLRHMRAQGELPLRVALMMDGDDADLDRWLGEVAPFHDPGAWLSWACVKYFRDGAMGSQGAHLLDDYTVEGAARGLPIQPFEELRTRVVSLMQSGWQVAIHAIGDEGARAVLDAFEAAGTDACQQVRPRLEHAQIVQPEDIRRFASLHTIASIQPIHMHSDAPWAPKVLGPRQLAQLFAWRALQSVTVLASGSDFPIDDPNPWHGIATAIWRRDAQGQVFAPDDALTRTEALLSYTEGAAFAAHWESRLGRLDPGFAADLIALDHDPFTASETQMWDMRPVAVWLAGAQVG